MKAGLRDLCGAMSAVLGAMATLSSISAVFTGNREMYVQAFVFGLAAAGVALSALLRM